MQHLILFFYIFSFSSGIGSIAVTIFLYLHYYKKNSLKYFLLLLISLCLMMLTLTLNKYFDVSPAGLPSNFKDYTSIIYLLANIIFIIGFPFYNHTLMGLKISRLRKYIFIAVDAVSILAGIYYIIFFEKAVMDYLIKPVLLFTGLYGFLLEIINIHNIGDEKIKKFIIFFLILTLAVLPLMIIEVYRDHIELLKNFDLFELFTLPLYFFVFNIAGIIILARYFKRPLFWSAGSLSDYFNETYNITEREKIIITYLIEGLNNTEISKKLFISVKTVENHLSNIYSKIGCKNRVQLVNLILSNK